MKKIKEERIQHIAAYKNDDFNSSFGICTGTGHLTISVFTWLDTYTFSGYYSFANNHGSYFDISEPIKIIKYEQMKKQIYKVIQHIMDTNAI